MAKKTKVRANNLEPMQLPDSEQHEEIRAVSKNADGTFQYDEISKSIHRSKGWWIDNFSNLSPGISSYPQLSRQDYDYFRPGEATPQREREILLACNAAYKKVGIIKNIIDLMGDFGCQGVRLTHPNKKIERFYKKWFKLISGVERSERFLNILYRLGTVITKIDYTKVNYKKQEKMSKVVANEKLIGAPEYKVVKREIPGKYTFLHPCLVETVGGRLSGFTSKPQYGIALSESVKDLIRNPKTDEEKEIVASLPQDMIDIVNSSRPYILPSENLWVEFYKKDDWDVRGESILASILDDITILEKLKLADITALDGACSMVRIYAMGDLEHQIAPTTEGANKFAAALQANTGAGIKEIVWGPAIKIIESNTDISKFLGEEKYRPTLNNIYTGLGIPPSLTGLFGSPGATNSFISLKTLTRRLEYGRQLLIKFWEAQIAIVQKAMGFRLPAQVEFDNVNLTDEEAEKSLLIQLADRNLISDELLQIKFGHNPDMERIRLKNERKARKKGKMIEKSGPYYEPQFELALQKIALQSGLVTPSEVGLELLDRKPGEKSQVELDQEMKKQAIKEKKLPKPNNGRPKNSRDTKQRDRRTFKPIKGHHIDNSIGALMVWAKNTQAVLYDRLNTLYLSLLKKKNLRQLTDSEANFLEKTKFGVFLNVSKFTDIDTLDKQWISNTLSLPINTVAYNQYLNLTSSVAQSLNKELNLDQLRYLQLITYINNK